MILYSTTLLQLQEVVVITIVAMDQNCCLILLLIVKLPQESLTGCSYRSSTNSYCGYCTATIYVIVTTVDDYCR